MGLLILFFYAFLLVILLGSALVSLELLFPPRRTIGYALARHLPTDPSQMGWQYTQHSFSLSDSSSTPGWIIRGSNPAGPVIVIQHGWGESSYNLLPRISPFIAHASYVLTFDLRGHGHAQSSRSCLGSTESLDLAAVLDQFHQLHPTHQPFLLMGYSMGAGIAIGCASQNTKHPIAALILEGASSSLPHAIAGKLKSLKYPRRPFVWLVSLFIRPWAGQALRLNRAAQLSRLTIPTLILHGQFDLVSPFAQAHMLAAASPHTRLVQFPQAGHLGLALADPSLYFASVQQFITQYFSPPSSSSPPSSPA